MNTAEQHLEAMRSRNRVDAAFPAVRHGHADAPFLDVLIADPEPLCRDGDCLLCGEPSPRRLCDACAEITHNEDYPQEEEN
jgi:hypothetical protein